MILFSSALLLDSAWVLCFVRCEWSMSYMQRPVWVLCDFCLSFHSVCHVDVCRTCFSKQIMHWFPFLLCMVESFADALKPVSLLLPSLLNAQWWHSDQKKIKVLIGTAGDPCRCVFCHSNPYRRTMKSLANTKSAQRTLITLEGIIRRKLCEEYLFAPWTSIGHSASKRQARGRLRCRPWNARGLILGSKIAKAKRRIAAATWQIKQKLAIFFCSICFYRLALGKSNKWYNQKGEPSI